MKTLVLLMVFVFLVVNVAPSFAQVPGTKAVPKTTAKKTDVMLSEEGNISPTSTSAHTYQTKLEGIEGPVYVGADWPSGTIVLRNGGVIDTYLLRYNLLSDQMQFIAGKDTLAFASPQELNTISFAGHTFVYDAFQCENTIRQGYFELIVPGKNKLLLKRSVTYQIPDEKKLSDASATKYLIDECYFISKPGTPASKVLCNRKNVLLFLDKHQNEIEEYLRITGNKVRNPEDLKKLVAYYNSLDEEK